MVDESDQCPAWSAAPQLSSSAALAAEYSKSRTMAARVVRVLAEEGRATGIHAIFLTIRCAPLRCAVLSLAVTLGAVAIASAELVVKRLDIVRLSCR